MSLPNPQVQARGQGLRILDLTALVAGYGLAALLMRAFWPKEAELSWVASGFVALTYGWLGLAMSGPLVLLINRRPRHGEADPKSPPQHTGAETAWLLIGGYWIGLALFVVPSRLPVNPLLGVFPILAACFFWAIRPARASREPRIVNWTHTAGIIVLAIWPFAWFAMIVLGRTMG